MQLWLVTQQNELGRFYYLFTLATECDYSPWLNLTFTWIEYKTHKQLFASVVWCFFFMLSCCCCRDALSHTARREVAEKRQLVILQNITDLLLRTFNSQFVFPALGHDDPNSRQELGQMWARWLPTDSMTTFETGKSMIKILLSKYNSCFIINVKLIHRKMFTEYRCKIL